MNANHHDASDLFLLASRDARRGKTSDAIRSAEKAIELLLREAPIEIHLKLEKANEISRLDLLRTAPAA